MGPEAATTTETTSCPSPVILTTDEAGSTSQGMSSALFSVSVCLVDEMWAITKLGAEEDVADPAEAVDSAVRSGCDVAEGFLTELEHDDDAPILHLYLLLRSPTALAVENIAMYGFTFYDGRWWRIGGQDFNWYQCLRMHY